MPVPRKAPRLLYREQPFYNPARRELCACGPTRGGSHGTHLAGAPTSLSSSGRPWQEVGSPAATSTCTVRNARTSATPQNPVPVPSTALLLAADC